jgi:crossover junction endodeoxyribonuclease RuvC
MRALGVDPGAAQGGLAIVELNDGAAPQLLDAIDLPVAGLGAGARIDVLAVCTWIKHHNPQHAYVERGMAMPRQGASSGYKFGRGVGAIEAAIACSGVAMSIVEPSVWKKFHGLRGKNKEQSMRREQLQRA